MNIRESSENDKTSIYKLHLEAFGEAEGEVVAKLAIDLLEDKSALPMLSLLAEEDSKIAGHVIFTTVHLSEMNIESGYILAPLAVAPHVQGVGIGSSLVKEGLFRLQQVSAAFVLVLGDPKYYQRFGFDAKHCIKPPHVLDYPEAWMALELQQGVLKDIRDTVQCATVLNDPQHW